MKFFTGREHKGMQKVLLGILLDAVHADVVVMARAILDFIYYAQLQSHTSETLFAMQSALNLFHEKKQILVALQIRENFNIPKLHSLSHYATSIELFGSPDGYNTEASEHLHIDFAKNAYRASNKRDALRQMTKWLSRQDHL
jgi:hypothetical protein